jgi:hypothetical protein
MENPSLAANATSLSHALPHQSHIRQVLSSNDKSAITASMLVMGLVMGQVKNGLITFAYPEDAKRNLIVQRKQ